MSSVKERIRDFEERSTPTQRDGVYTPSSKRRVTDSPMVTPSSYRNVQRNAPFVSPIPRSSRRMGSITNSCGGAMTDMTNFQKALPVPRRLKLENQENDGSLMEGGSNDAIETDASTELQRKKNDNSISEERSNFTTIKCASGIITSTALKRKEHDGSLSKGRSTDAIVNSTSKADASSVLKLKKEFEQHIAVTKRERQLRDAKLGHHSASKHPSSIPRIIDSVHMANETDGNNVIQEIILSPSESEHSLIGKHRSSSASRNWKRFWEFLYASLAILELFSCRDFRGAIHISTPKAFLPPSSFSFAAQISQHSSSSARTTTFGVTEDRGYWGRNAHIVMMHRAYNAVSFFSWEDFINKAFIIAIFLHTVMESWALASSRNREKRQREEHKALETSTLVTRRSKQRFQNLETASSNRHIIMKWTRNRIRWNRATTEIFRASCFILLFRLLFLPILRKKRFIGIDHSSIRQHDIAGRTLSFGESLIMDVALWFHSRAVTHYRRKLKEYAVRFATFALMRPWEASVRVQNVFTLIRWTKFLAPRIGTFNKLRGHLQDYNKKKDRKQRSEKARLLWSNLIDSILAEKKVDRAIRRIQRIFKVRRERTRLAKAKRRLSGIAMTNQLLYNQDRELADTLRREIRERSRKNLRLLLRPNTTFSIAWKRTTITCVVIEVSYLFLSPLLSPKSRKLALDEVVTLLLTPAAERFAPLSRLQVSTVVVELISHRIANLVSMVSFLDVFITFFTGELDERTGLLVPKPFFNRWIFPGVVLQLIVNPTMKDMSAMVRKIITFCHAVGPMRVFHVLLALLPVVEQIMNWSIDITYQFVDAENRSVLRK